MDPARPTPDANPAAAAWPRPAQLTAAFLLGAGSALLAARLLGQPAHRPTDFAAGPAVDLNRAGRAELLQLPGVGPALAGRIVDRRDAGPFQSADDLRSVPGVGKGTFGRVRPFVTTDLPPVSERAAQSGYAVKPPPAAGPLDVNSATAEQLQTLPGVGPKTAERIVAERARRPFASVEELRRVVGIGPKTLAKLRPFVKVVPPPADGSRDGGEVPTGQ